MVQVNIFEDSGTKSFFKGKVKWIVSIVLVAIGLIIRTYWMIAAAVGIILLPKILALFKLGFNVGKKNRDKSKPKEKWGLFSQVRYGRKKQRQYDTLQRRKVKSLKRKRKKKRSDNRKSNLARSNRYFSTRNTRRRNSRGRYI